MSQLSGIVSLFFIAAALATSWFGEPQQQSEILLPTLAIGE